MKRPKLAPDAPTELTGGDLMTIKQALNYALVERLSYLDAIKGCGMTDVEKRNRKMVKGFNDLHVKLFGCPTDETVRLAADALLETVTIFPVKDA